MTNAEFCDMYWAAQPLEVQVLKDMVKKLYTDELQYADLAVVGEDLAKKGYKIDAEIMIYGNNPWSTMLSRQRYGYTWYPSLFQEPIRMTPGNSAPSVPSYDPLNPPPGSIKITLDPADYPSVVPPVIQPPTPMTAKPNFSIPPTPSGTYYTIAGDTSGDGTKYEGRGELGEPVLKFRKVVKYGPFGGWAWWEVVN